MIYLKKIFQKPHRARRLLGAGMIVAAAFALALAWDAEAGGISRIRGLEAYDYTFGGYYEEEASPADRWPITSLDQFVRMAWMDDHRDDAEEHIGAIAVARVLDTTPAGKAQIATLRPLAVLGDELPEEIKIIQKLAGGCTDELRTNLVREGGVYVLRLSRQRQAILQQQKNRETQFSDTFLTIWNEMGIRDLETAAELSEIVFRVSGDLDCLLEVDDRGLIRSHSKYPGYNRYDDKPLAMLWRDVRAFYKEAALTS
jgi:hypothetical protein